ncbi:MAG: ATP-binding cassette domain-containing protein [Candidatus Nitrosocaldaceae archaeon]
MIIFKAENLCLNLNGKDILKNVSLTVEKGNAITIMGPNGAGKTTLMRVILGILKPTTGKLYFFGGNGLNKEIKKVIGYIPQNLGLVNELNVMNNILIGALRRVPRWRSILGLYPNDIIDEANELLDVLKLSHLKNSKVKNLSGGEKQRVAIARVLLQKPLLILADEMTASLDLKASREIMDILMEMKDKMNLTLIMIHHNPDIAKMYSDTIFIMVDGRLEKVIEANAIDRDELVRLYER